MIAGNLSLIVVPWLLLYPFKSLLLKRNELSILEFFLIYLLLYSSKQCTSFKTRAIQVKEGLEKDVSGITVLVNPDKVCLVIIGKVIFLSSILLLVERRFGFKVWKYLYKANVRNSFCSWMLGKVVSFPCQFTLWFIGCRGNCDKIF